MLRRLDCAVLKRWLALGALTLAVVMLAVDGTVLALAVPALTEALQPSASQILWIGDIYSFALAGLLVTMGNVADRIGRKRLLLIGSACFGIASVVAAYAPTAELLIAARALLGFAGATIMPSTLAIVRNLFDEPAQRTRAIAVWSAGATAGAALGPLVGGALLEHFWWGSVFLINVPVIILVLAAGFFLLPESRNPARSPIDLLSAALSILAIVPVVYAIKQLVGKGFDLSVAVATAIGITAAILFVRRQGRSTSPLIDLQLFKIPAFSGAVAANGLAIFGFIGLLFFVSQFLQLVHGLSPLQAGLAELPSAIASIVVITIATTALRTFGRGRAISIGLGIAAAGFAALAIFSGKSGLIAVIVSLAIIGLGASLAMTLSTDAVVASAPKERAGAASSIAETAYELGVALGIAILGSVHTALYRASLADTSSSTPDDAAAIRESLAAASGTVPADVFADGQHAFTIAMQGTSALAGLLILAAAVIAWRVIPSRQESAPVSH